MKVALVHDYIKEYGGAERVLETLHEMYPDAPVYTSVYLPEFLGPHKERFKNWNIKTSWLQYIPYKHKLISPFRLLSPFVFRVFSVRGGPAFGWDLSEFDVVIVSATGAYFPNMVRTKSPLPPLLKGVSRRTGDLSGAVHICYCHTPPRYLYGYATARDWKKYKIFAVLSAVANHFLRMVDFTASKNVDFYIANSEEVASRIKKFYRREAKVVYPPVDIKNPKSEYQNPKQIQNTNSQNQKGGYYLTGGRLARAKHVDVILQACQELGVQVKIFGRGFAGYEEELKSQKSKFKRPHPDPLLKGEGNRRGIIEFLGEVSDNEKFEKMREAKAFIFAGEDEDFGIVPVEAMSVGTPVIAYKSGGVKETILQGRTGLFFEELTADSLKKAIKKFEKIKFDPEKCRQQAEKFSKERFMKEIKNFINLKNQKSNLQLKSKIFEI